MAVFEYKCQDCGTRYEARQKIADAPHRTCPTCQGPLIRLITGCAFQLIGRGFHVNEYTRRGIK